MCIVSCSSCGRNGGRYVPNHYITKLTRPSLIFLSALKNVGTRLVCDTIAVNVVAYVLFSPDHLCVSVYGTCTCIAVNSNVYL